MITEFGERLPGLFIFPLQVLLKYSLHIIKCTYSTMSFNKRVTHIHHQNQDIEYFIIPPKVTIYPFQLIPLIPGSRQPMTE